MTTFTVPAVYKDGVLKPEVKLNLPDNTPVQVEVTPIEPAPASASSLFGSFPALSDVSDEALRTIQQTWERGLVKQVRLLDDVD